jgi:hypothetical protein
MTEKAGTDDPQETARQRLLQAIGQAISDWALVEEALFELFFREMNCSALGPPAAAFVAADSIRTKLAMVDAMVWQSARPAEALQDWRALKKRLDHLGPKRNRLAHRKVVQLRPGREPSTPMLVDYTHDYEHMLRPGGAPHDLWSFAQKTHQP